MNKAAILAAVLWGGAAWAQGGQPASGDWYPSKYGADDRIGAMNELSPETTVAAAKLVKLGKVYALGVVTGPETPAYPGRGYRTVITQSSVAGATTGANTVTAHDDLVVANMGVGTQIDGFAHLGIGHRYYNGVSAAELYGVDGVTTFGTEDIPPVATRGILLDMTKQYGTARLPAGTAFNRAEIDAAAKAAGVTIGKGDIVLFHTGWLGLAEENPAAFVATQPGLGKDGAEYLASLGVVMVGADTAALEAIPFENADEPFIVHQTLLAKNGVHVLETINTAELAADGATEFLLTIGQPRFKGTVQIVVNPVAVR